MLHPIQAPLTWTPVELHPAFLYTALAKVSPDCFMVCWPNILRASSYVKSGLQGFAQAPCDSPMASNCLWRSKYSRLSIPINRRRHMISRGAPAEQRYRLSLLLWLWLWRSPDRARAFHPWEMGCLLFRVVHRGLTSVRWNKLNAFEHGKMCDFFWRSQEKIEKAPSYTFIKSILVLLWFLPSKLMEAIHHCSWTWNTFVRLPRPSFVTVAFLNGFVSTGWWIGRIPPKRRKVIQQKLSFSWSVAYLSLNGAWWCHETSQNMHEKSWTHSVHLKHKHSPGCNLQ